MRCLFTVLRAQWLFTRLREKCTDTRARTLCVLGTRRSEAAGRLSNRASNGWRVSSVPKSGTNAAGLCLFCLSESGLITADKAPEIKEQKSEKPASRLEFASEFHTEFKNFVTSEFRGPNVGCRGAPVVEFGVRKFSRRFVDSLVGACFTSRHSS